VIRKSIVLPYFLQLRDKLQIIIEKDNLDVIFKIVVEFRAILTAANVKQIPFWAVVVIGSPVLAVAFLLEEPTSNWGSSCRDKGLSIDKAMELR